MQQNNKLHTDEIMDLQESSIMKVSPWKKVLLQNL